MTAEAVYKKAEAQRKDVDYGEVFSHLERLSQGAWNDILDTKNTDYYQWSSALVDALKPKMVVELGGAMGVWCCMVLPVLPKDSKLYSVTLKENGLEFCMLCNCQWKNFFPVVGSDLDLTRWPKDLDFKKTDILFIDSEHTAEHLKKELDLYLPLLSKGTIVLLDDIFINLGMRNVWDSLPYDKFSAPLHHSGYGIFIYN